MKLNMHIHPVYKVYIVFHFLHTSPLHIISSISKEFVIFLLIILMDKTLKGGKS